MAEDKLIEDLIGECEVGEFKLEDSTFVEICAKHKVTEEEAMQKMLDVPKHRGTFMRVPYGWIFVENDAPHCGSTYDGKLFFKNGELDMAFIERIAE